MAAFLHLQHLHNNIVAAARHVTRIFRALLPGRAISSIPTMRQETDEVFMLRVSFHSHKNSVRHQSSLQMRKPRHKEFRIWLQIISLITGTTRVFSQSSLLPQLPVCLHLPHFPHTSLIPGPEGERVLLWGNASTMVAST